MEHIVSAFVSENVCGCVAAEEVGKAHQGVIPSKRQKEVECFMQSGHGI